MVVEPDFESSGAVTVWKRQNCMDWIWVMPHRIRTKWWRENWQWWAYIVVPWPCIDPNGQDFHGDFPSMTTRPEPRGLVGVVSITGDIPYGLRQVITVSISVMLRRYIVIATKHPKLVMTTGTSSGWVNISTSAWRDHKLRQGKKHPAGFAV